MFRSKKIIITLSLIIFSISSFAHKANAQSLSEDFYDIVPNSQTKETVSMGNGSGIYPLIRLTHDKLETIDLEDDAVSIIVGNPAHLNILLDTPRKLILVPKQPGATHFKVLNYNGQTIMERHAIIASPKQDFVRIRNTCSSMGENAAACQEFNTFFCPDMCHDVSIPKSDEKLGEIPEDMPAQNSNNNKN